MDANLVQALVALLVGGVLLAAVKVIRDYRIREDARLRRHGELDAEDERDSG